MQTATVSDYLAAPVEHVFAAFTDIEHGALKVSGIKSIEMLTPGQFGVNTRWLETREVLGVLDSAEMRVTAFDRNHGYTVSHDKAGAHIETVFTFEPWDEGTKVTVAFQMSGPGLPPGLLAPVSWAIAGKVREALTRDLADMKEATTGVVNTDRA